MPAPETLALSLSAAELSSLLLFATAMSFTPGPSTTRAQADVGMARL